MAKLKTKSTTSHETLLADLAACRRVRHDLPDGGRLYVDRRLPFICVYRTPDDRPDPGTAELITSEPAYLVVPGEAKAARRSLTLLKKVISETAEHFGSFLVVELWADERLRDDVWSAPEANGTALAAARFRLSASRPRIPRTTLGALGNSLRRVRVCRRRGDVAISEAATAHPENLKPLLSASELQKFNCYQLGLAVAPVYTDPDSGEIYPVVLQSMRRGLSRALKQAFFTFVRKHTQIRPRDYYALGRRSVGKPVREVDRQLAEIDRSFDLLLQATPVNAEEAWREFRRSKFEEPPTFFYRPLAIDPTLLKRQLYNIPLESIEDPTIAYLFRQKQDELDRQLTLVSDVGTVRFLPENLQIFGSVPSGHLKLAQDLLDKVPTRDREDLSRNQLNAVEIGRRAGLEIGYYAKLRPDFQAHAQVRDDVFSGMLVSKFDLLIGHKMRAPERRVGALLQHEIGTHLLTRYNGRQQPFQQLEVGLAGYDGLQEGLAVLAEYLSGGLSRSRIRVLAARVVAADQMIRGASFIETFRMLDRNHEFSQRTAYTITMRTYRGGGLSKDALYLRGLVEVLEYLANDGDIDALFVGKIASSHLPMISELRSRKLVTEPALRPHYLDDPAALARLQRVRNGLTVLQLLEPEPKR